MKASVAELVQLPGLWRGGELEHAAQPPVPTGHAVLDAELPGGGWPNATLAEVLHDAAGIGEVSFLAGALARASEAHRLIAWVNPPLLPYAPALAQVGISLDRCLIVRPANREDALWAVEQALKSGACGAVLFWLHESMPQSHGQSKPMMEQHRARSSEYAWLRRLQLAAATGRSMAIYFRSSAAERLSTPAHLRVVLESGQGALRIRIPKRRGPPLVKPVALQLALSFKANRQPAPKQDNKPQITVTANLPVKREHLHLVSH